MSHQDRPDSREPFIEDWAEFAAYLDGSLRFDEANTELLEIGRSRTIGNARVSP